MNNKLNPRTYKKGRGWLPPPSEFFLMFFLDDKVSGWKYRNVLFRFCKKCFCPLKKGYKSILWSRYTTKGRHFGLPPVADRDLGSGIA